MILSIVDLPHVNASLNGASIVLLTAGYVFIRRGEQNRHRACMLGALMVSAMFLVSYLIYHFNAGLARFGGEGWVRPAYFTLLITHVIVAAAIIPMVAVTVFRALSRRFDRHKRIARWTWPMWMFVAVTGVVVYVMAVHLFPDPAGPYAHVPYAHG